MSEELLPFDQENCPKCRYGTNPVCGREYGSTMYQEAISEDVTRAGGTPARSERLYRRCQRCGYIWHEKTADADE